MKHLNFKKLNQLEKKPPLKLTSWIFPMKFVTFKVIDYKKKWCVEIFKNKNKNSSILGLVFKILK
jgi:hypothetical protein